MLLAALLGVPASAAPPLPVAPPVAPAAPVAPTGPCAAGDRPLFDCSLADGRRILVCGGAGRLQYRFGAVGAPELVFPADAAPAVFTVEQRTFVRSQRDVLRFDNEGVRYEVTEAIGGGGGDDAAENNFCGVVVEKPIGTRIASVSCAGELQSDWDAIRALAPKPMP